VDVVAQKYFWTFEYEGGNVTSRGKLVLPKDETVYLTITSVDWLHAFHVPEMGLKQDAVPGESHVLRTTPTTTGEFQGYCAEYCGAGHSGMLFEVEVMNESAYRDWLDDQRS
ncbi:cytochrome c oxidase subunit II, partial [Halobacteriales archaeon SW_7_68_16]